ncbi:MAG: hypothetical protein Q7J16_12400 [Candidatus Cloacimonadales bacterium]|nr:hypothetical protein [Candidatus Cloacimonadales bacterium]
MGQRPFTVNLDEEIITKINNLAKINEMKTSELVSRVLQNFVNSFDILKNKKQTQDAAEPDDEKYVEYYESLRKILSTGDIPKNAKKFLVG